MIENFDLTTPQGRTRCFWYFVRERHLIWHRRFKLNQRAPWTEDAILDSRHFTNVYRELDPGTMFIRKKLEHASKQRLGNLVFNAAVYRLFLHERSFNEMGWTLIDQFDAEKWKEKLAAIHKPYHSAYYIHNLQLTVPKYEAMTLCATDLVEKLLSGMERDLATIESREEWMGKFSNARGFGPFLACQVMTDLAYDGHIKVPADGYVELGPGASRGLSALGLDGETLQDTLERLHRTQPQIPHGDYLTFMNLQNCCCEFSKYIKNTTRRRFDSMERQLAQGELF